MTQTKRKNTATQSTSAKMTLVVMVLGEFARNFPSGTCTTLPSTYNNCSDSNMLLIIVALIAYAGKLSSKVLHPEA